MHVFAIGQEKTGTFSCDVKISSVVTTETATTQSTVAGPEEELTTDFMDFTTQF